MVLRARKVDALQGTLDMLVLKTLTDGPLHGYGVLERIVQLTEEAFQVEEGALYPALHRLEKRDLVEAEWGVSDNNRRAKYYRLTRAGRAHLAHEIAAWERASSAIAKLLQARLAEA